MPNSQYRVAVTAEARADFREIATYLRGESPVLAIRVVRQLRIAALELGDRALRYALLPRHEESGIRRRVVGSYNIFYRVAGDRVDVLHVLHHARDDGRILFPED